jgi:hypothetical protein
MVFAEFATTVIVVCILGGLLAVRNRLRDRVRSGLVSTLAVGTLLGSPALMEVFLRGPLPDASVRGIYIDPSPFMMWLPAIAGVFLIAAARLLFPANESRPATKDRCWFVALLLAFALLNCVNWCSPGWCERLGFPLAYSSSSDAVVVMNGTNVAGGFDKMAIFLNAVVAAAAAGTLAMSYRRRTPRG